RAIPKGLPVIGMQMQGNEMDAGTDLVLLEQLDEFVTADAQSLEIQLEDIEMPGMLPISGESRSGDFWNVLEPLGILGGNALAGLPKLITLLELLNTDGRRQVRQVVFVARGENLIVPGPLGRVPLPGVLADPVEAHDPHTLGPLWVLGRRHAAFARRDRLGGIKGEAGDIANGANPLLLKTSRQRVRGIFDHPQVVRLGDLQD